MTGRVEQSVPALSGDEAARLSQAEKLDYAAIGFRCGLEIHQQLDTRKLFSPCPSRVVEPDEIAPLTVAVVERALRATASESGEVDIAARAEAAKGKRFRYLAIAGFTSLVELDEEPPHPLAPDARRVGLTFAGLVDSRPVDEIHVMRKTVIDGSNTGGFQRTALISTGGKLAVEGGDVGVWTIALEEDSARKLEGEEGLVTYTLDRLGIPLIEIATAPDIKDPAHAQRTAARIGALMRATGRVKRGLGTIRQDLNVSVGVGDRVELKGCQDLRAVARVIEQECRRQLWMHHIGETLRARGFNSTSIEAPVDASKLFQASQAKLVKDAVAKGASVLALRLPHWGGLIKGATKEGPRLGREFADHARIAAGVKGVFHSDELPGYGITDAEVAAVRTLLACATDDGFVLCVEKPAVARRALAAVAERARQAIGAPIKEVRAAQPDDSTRFMRPMPGSARMYPETDVPPLRVSTAEWRGILAHLPPKPEERVRALVQVHKLSIDSAQQLVAEGSADDFEALVSVGAEPSLAARTLLQFVPSLKHADRILHQLPAVFAALANGRFAKEAVPDLLAQLDGGAADVDAAIAKAGLAAADTTVVDQVIARVLAERADYVASRGMAAIGPLMGPVMAELRGKADGQVISARLKAALEAASASKGPA